MPLIQSALQTPSSMILLLVSMPLHITTVQVFIYTCVVKMFEKIICFKLVFWFLKFANR